MKKNQLVYASILMAMVFWSLSFIWYKEVYQFYLPVTTVLLRLIISSFLLFMFAKMAGRFNKLKVVHLKYFVLAAFFEPFLYFLGESYGMLYLSPTLASLIIATIPLFTPIAAIFIYKERLTHTNLSGIAISVVGVGLFIFEKGYKIESSFTGISLMSLAVIGAIGYAIVVRKLSDHYNAFTIVAVQNFIGIFMFVPLFLIFEVKQFLNTGITAQSIIPVLKLSIFASGFAFVFFIYALRNLGVSKANTFTNLIPVFTAIFSFFLLNESFSTGKITGIGVVILGLFLSQMNFKRMGNFNLPVDN